MTRQNMDSLLVETVDGEPLEREKARTLSKRDKHDEGYTRDANTIFVLLTCACCLNLLFYAGWLFLPWLWAVNVWMFWPDFKNGDVVIKQCESHAASTAMSAQQRGHAHNT